MEPEKTQTAFGAATTTTLTPSAPQTAEYVAITVQSLLLQAEAAMIVGHVSGCHDYRLISVQ